MEHNNRSTARRAVASVLSAVCLVVCGNPQPGAQHAKSARVRLPDARVWIEGLEPSIVSKWETSTCELGVELVNNSPSPAWFLVRIRGVERMDAPGSTNVLRAVKLRARDLGFEAPAIELCHQFGCDVAVHLHPGAHLSFREKTTDGPTADGKLAAEVWRLASLDFEDEPAEQWISRVLPDGSRRPQQGQHDVLVGQVELAIDQRWEFPLDMTKRVAPRSF